MRKRIGTKIGALALLAGVGILIVSGCVIRIVPGTGETTDSTGGNSNGGGAGSGGDMGSGGQTLEEQGAEALAQVTPQALALNEAKTGFAAYDTMGLVATSVSDPSTLDEETLMQLLVQYAPTGYDDATKWLASIDPTTLSSPPVVPDFDKCVPPPYDCDGVVSCDFAKSA